MKVAISTKAKDMNMLGFLNPFLSRLSFCEVGNVIDIRLRTLKRCKRGQGVRFFLYNSHLQI